MNTKLLSLSSLVFFAVTPPLAQAAQSMNCSVSILRQNKNLPDPTSPEGPGVIVGSDGKVIKVIQNRSTEVQTERFAIPVDGNKARKKLSAAFGKDLEAIVGVQEVIADDEQKTLTIVTTLEIQATDANGQKRSLALTRNFSPTTKMKLTVFNSELATAAIKIGQDDVMDDLARPIKEGALASGSMLFAVMECR